MLITRFEIVFYQKKVIMAVWDIREYQSTEGKLPVSEWYEALSPGNRARADKFIRIAQNLDQLEMPYFRKFRQLLEARWFGENKVPHRIFCYVASGKCVVFLCGCTHKDNRYDPTNAYATAARRRGKIEAGRAGTRELDF